jgi:L-alanine-DL-glutamate epimerase-like enolase superfamily enzyme
MKIESVDLYYLSMPVVRDIADGSQDALLVRVCGGGLTGWGESEASPLVSIANWCCPMSHAACRPVRDAVLGQTLDSPQDILRINNSARSLGLDIAQTDHTLSGIDIALWDLLGKARGEPVYKLLGYPRAFPKTPYASRLFGDSPQQTLEKAKQSLAQGYRAAKFGWGPYGRGQVETDRDHVMAAREGLGKDAVLLIDAGTIWYDDVERAALRLAALEEAQATWLEEPFVGGALDAYRSLASRCRTVKLAGGEGAHNFFQARHLIDHGGVAFIQIDTGRIGGITDAKQVADYACARGVTYVNHTFTSHLALSASLQPFAGLADHALCEYPVEASDLARALSRSTLERNREGQVELSEAPGLGVEPDLEALKPYLVDVKVTVKGRTLYETPVLTV